MNVRRFTPSGTVLVAAVALVIGMEAPAMAHQVDVMARHISGTTIKAHSIPGDRLKNNTLTGTQIKESTLGTVPRARTLPPLVWHEITSFVHGWGNVGQGRLDAAYAVDAQGIVHFRGSISGGTSGTLAFTLPASLLPTTRIFSVPAVVDGSFGYLAINDGGVAPTDGTGTLSGSASTATSLTGVTFPAG
jgi:hypothetical protein